jgi:hypothetical protein
VLWLGRGLKPIVFITGLICLVPLLFGVTAGLRSADPAAPRPDAVVDAPAGRSSPGPPAVRAAVPVLGDPHLCRSGADRRVLAEWYALVDQGLGRRIQEAIDFNRRASSGPRSTPVALLGGLAIVVLNVLERRLSTGTRRRARCAEGREPHGRRLTYPRQRSTFLCTSPVR